ncbi:Hypothetical protein A7982_03860 [Minicystis rosea]|nr:Hypothetical protein A7982_03860 [Minicystis rosea]
MADVTEMALDGVTLAQFAFVRAGLTDGLGLGELLGFLRLDARTWEAAEEAWDEHVLDAIEDDPSFFDALEAATAEARTHWTRRIPPLDEDLRSWFDFLQAWLAHPDPVAFLEEMKLGVADLAHLHRLWSDRLAEDAKLRADALELLQGERREPPVPAPERPRLIQTGPTPRGRDGKTATVVSPRTRALPFGEGEPGPLPPPLAVPLPRRKRAHATAPGLDETRLGGVQEADAALPFTASAFFVSGAPAAPVDAALVSNEPVPPAWVARHEADHAAPVPVVVDPDATTVLEMPSGKIIPLAEAFERAPATAEPMLTIELHARLVAELTTGAEVNDLLARHGLTPEAKQSEDERWGRALNRAPELQRRWMQAFEEARARLARSGESS